MCLYIYIYNIEYIYFDYQLLNIHHANLTTMLPSSPNSVSKWSSSRKT